MSLEAYKVALELHAQAVADGCPIARETFRAAARSAWDAYVASQPRRSIPRVVISPLQGPTEVAQADGGVVAVVRPWDGSGEIASDGAGRTVAVAWDQRRIFKVVRVLDFSQFTDAQMDRIHADCWARMTRDDGSQPFGYDWPTLWATKPEWARVLQAIGRETERRTTLRWPLVDVRTGRLRSEAVAV